jgi:hypothetical protein
VEQPVFHVMLEGRKVGPYDRRTIVGMRIKKTLTSGHVLSDSGGMTLTVADLIGRVPRSNDFSPNRTGGFSVVQATFPASLTSVQGKGLQIPGFKGEVEARVQSDVVRIAGSFRRGFGLKEGRVKLPLKDIVHTHIDGSQVQLWLRPGEGKILQRVTLELFTNDAAKELVGLLPSATPWPEAVVPASVADGAGRGVGAFLLWASVVAVVFVVGVVVVLVLHLRR